MAQIECRDQSVKYVSMTQKLQKQYTNRVKKMKKLKNDNKYDINNLDMHHNNKLLVDNRMQLSIHQMSTPSGPALTTRTRGSKARTSTAINNEIDLLLPWAFDNHGLPC